MPIVYNNFTQDNKADKDNSDLISNIKMPIVYNNFTQDNKADTDDCDYKFEIMLQRLTEEINLLVDNFETSSMITYLAMDGFLNIFEIIKFNIDENTSNKILKICDKYFNQENIKDIKIFNFIKTKYPEINNELIYSIIKQKKILLNVNTFNLLFNRYLSFDKDTINALISM